MTQFALDGTKLLKAFEDHLFSINTIPRNIIHYDESHRTPFKLCLSFCPAQTGFPSQVRIRAVPSGRPAVLSAATQDQTSTHVHCSQGETHTHTVTGFSLDPEMLQVRSTTLCKMVQPWEKPCCNLGANLFKERRIYPRTMRGGSGSPTDLKAVGWGNCWGT